MFFKTAVIINFFFLNVTVAGELSPKLGLGMDETNFEKAVSDYQKEHGDEMGFGLTPCNLKPLLEGADSMKISRSIVQKVDDKDQMMFVGFKNKKVVSWKPVTLPGFSFWITKYVYRCTKDSLVVGSGKGKYIYLWDGKSLTLKK